MEKCNKTGTRYISLSCFTSSVVVNIKNCLQLYPIASGALQKAG